MSSASVMGVLNTMFNDTVNGAFKQFVENSAMHATAQRLYEAALVLSKGAATKPGEVAAFFGVTQQRLKNWESRGLSQQGMVSVCEKHAIDLPWLAGGTGAPPQGASTPGAQMSLLGASPPAPARTTLEQALQIIDEALSPLDAADRRVAAHMLTGMEVPGKYQSVAAMFSGAINAMSSKLRAA